MIDHVCMESFLPQVREWFRDNVGEPSEPQKAGWPLIADHRDVLICAPTGSGKTLAAFMKCIDYLYRIKASGNKSKLVKVVYISPLKALNNDIYRNLELPLAGIAQKAEALGKNLPAIRAAVRTGDTPQKERIEMLKNPPDILITTPESLFIMLTSAKISKIFSEVEYIIVDEIHSIYSSKRGVHFSLSLERLQRLSSFKITRIGLSATVNPLEEAAGFLGGFEAAADEEGKIQYKKRDVTIVNCDGRRKLDIVISCPVKDYKSIPEGTIWSGIYSQILALIRSHRSSLVFVNNRRLAELVCAGVNTLAGEQLVKSHHGSISKEMRQELELQLKNGRLPCLVATSTLEMGIDIGSIDLVIQVGTADSASQALQRIGRAGHRMDAVSRGILLPRNRGDLIKASFVISQAADFKIEQSAVPANCLDVLAQQVTSVACRGDICFDELYGLIRCAWPYRELPQKQLESVLSMLAYPSPDDEPDLIKPRIFYDRVSGVVKGTSLGRMMCLTSGGTIPDKGSYPVYLTNTELKLGELEEQFVFESRIGDRFYLGSTAWKIDRIEHDRVWVSQTNASGAEIPFWIGDKTYRAYETGLRYGKFLRTLEEKVASGGYEKWAGHTCGLDRTSAENLKEYVEDQIKAAGVLHNDRLIICEYFSDEAGEKRIMIHTPFGGRIHAVMAALLHGRLVKLLGCIVEYVFNDDGILIHIVGPAGKLRGILSLLEECSPEEEIFSCIPSTPAFNMGLRYNLSRSLLLYSKNKKSRKPLWIQRLRSAEIAQYITGKPDHPIVAETFREVLSDVFDIKGFSSVLKDIRSGRIGVREVVTGHPSPFCTELLFNFWQAYQYTEDLPVAERRNQLLLNDREFVKMAVGLNGEYDLIDERAVELVKNELFKVKYGRRITTPDELYFFIYSFGEFACSLPVVNHFKDIDAQKLKEFLELLEGQGRILRFKLKDGTYWIAAEDYPAYCRMTGTDLYSYTFEKGFGFEAETVKAADWLNSYILSIDAGEEDSVLRVLKRYSRFSAPFTSCDIKARYGISDRFIEKTLDNMVGNGDILQLKYSAQLSERVYCHAAVYSRIRKKTVELARKDIKPKTREAFTEFLFEYHGIGESVTIPEEKLVKVVGQLKGVFFPAAWWEDFIFPVRVKGYEPRVLDYLCSTGSVNWVGRINGSTGEVAFYPGESAISTGAAENLQLDEEEIKALDTLKALGACFLRDYAKAMKVSADELIKMVEPLVWNGAITNDSFAVVRYYLDNRKKNSPWTKYGTYPSLGRWYTVERDNICCGPMSIQEYISKLLNIYGMVNKEIVNSNREGFRWSDVYLHLKNNELSSGIKRGYFVTGLSAIQFVRDKEIERLRNNAPSKEDDIYITICSCDPANPYRDVLTGEKGIVPGRNPGSVIVFRNGEPVLLVKEYGNCIHPLSGDESVIGKALASFINSFSSRLLWTARKNIVTEMWGEGSVEDSAFYNELLTLGYERGYKGITLWKRTT